MGMAASQGRLLFMTARISNNEFEQQCVAYSKQRLADDSQTANDKYLEALQATQYQVLAGYNGDSPYYEPVTYSQLTSLNSVAVGKQYIVSDNKGQIVVTKDIAESFDKNYLNNNGKLHNNYDFNTFLKNVSAKMGISPVLTQVEKTTITEADVHDAWDKYFVSINKGHENGIYYDKSSRLEGSHVLGFSFTESKENDIVYASYNAAYINSTAGANNQIFLQEEIADDGTSNYYYKNIPVEVETYRDDEGNPAYIAKYKYPDYLIQTSDANKKNMMDDDGYIYLTGLKITPSVSDNGVGYTFEKEDGSNFEYKDENGNTVTTSSLQELYVNQDYGNATSPAYTGLSSTKVTTAPVQEKNSPIFYEGSTAEQRELYDYAMAITEKYAKGDKLQYDADKIKYFKNIYDQMTTKGYTTFDKMVQEGYINTMTYDHGTGQPVGVGDESQALKNDNWLINQLKNGKLAISYYDATEKDFIGTTLDDDESIVEKENKSKIAIAEQTYQTHMDRIEREDKQFDMQLTKLESEHTALTTEYESVSKVISKNVEKSFNVFNA